MKNREFLYQSGEPVDPHKVSEYQEKQRSLLVEQFKKDPQVEGVLGRFRFDVLTDIFAEHFKKLNIPEKSINVLTAEHIHSGTLACGSYILEDNLIALSLENIKARFKGVSHWELAVIRTLIHEETHAVSFRRCLGLPYFEHQKADERGEKLRRGEKFYNELQSGYSRQISAGVAGEMPESMQLQRLFVNFNEGVVEKLSREVFSQYVKKDSNFATKKDVENFKQQLIENPKAPPYEREVLLVEALVERLAKEAGIPEEVVWGGFVRGLFEGEKLEDEELREMFSSMFSEVFMERLLTFKSDEEYQRLLGEIQTEPILPASVEFIHDFSDRNEI